MQNLTPVRFNWDTQSDQAKNWPAFTDGTTWNGWPNLWIERAVFLEMMDFLDAEAGPNADLDDNGNNEMRQLPADEDGFVCIGWGYTPTIITSE